MVYISNNLFFTFIILGNPGATSRDDAIFSSERYFRANVYFKCWRAPGNLFLPNQFQKWSNSVPADWAEKYFSAQSAERNSTTSGTGSVRISSQGLLSTWSKLSPENIASSRLVARGFPRMYFYMHLHLHTFQTIHSLFLRLIHLTLPARKAYKEIIPPYFITTYCNTSWSETDEFESINWIAWARATRLFHDIL